MEQRDRVRYNLAWGGEATAAPERDRNLSVGEYFRRRYDKAPKSLAFAASSQEEMDEWRRSFSLKLRECLGPFPESCFMDPEVIESVDTGPYRREKVLYNTEPDMAVVAYVFVPNDIEPGERRPGILACHGHGNGKDDLANIDHGERLRRVRIDSHNYDYAHQLALRGYVVVAPDWRAFGERKLGGDFGQRDACNVFFIKGMLMGVNLLALNVWDALRSIEYLQLRPEVDPGRIGCVGLSYGGTMTLYAAALDERVKCAVVSGYLNSFEAYAIGNGQHVRRADPIRAAGVRRVVGRRVPHRAPPAAHRVGRCGRRLPHRGQPRRRRIGEARIRGCGRARPVRRGRVRRRPPVERAQGLRLARQVAPRRRRVGDL